MDIKEIAETINEKAKDYQMSTFYQLRKKLHKKQRVNKKIFTCKSIKDDYAFHIGGRHELQFNIGFIEYGGEEKFRYGVALSFFENKSLPKYTELEWQFFRFSEYLEYNKSKLRDYILYYHDKINDIENFISLDELSNKLYSIDYFIFFGKLMPTDKIDFHKILTTFDELLDLYKYAEGNGELIEHNTATDNVFEFKPGFSPGVETSSREFPVGEIDVEHRHNLIQDKMYHLFVKKYGKNNVRKEQNTGVGTSIDIVTKTPSGLDFYEIKTHSSLRYCIREALGQLIEYGYWPKRRNPNKLIIVSEAEINNQAIEFLITLRNDMNLNIYYRQFDFDNNTLSDLN